MCISARERLCISGRQRLCMSGRQRLLLFSTNRISVCLRNREYCSSATRKSSPNPSYLRSGEFVLSWDTKNRSSHTQIIHIEILRAQMYLKSDETEGNLLSEHMNIFARNRLLAPKRVILYSPNIIINFWWFQGGRALRRSSAAAPRRSRGTKLRRSRELGATPPGPLQLALFGEWYLCVDHKHEF